MDAFLFIFFMIGYLQKYITRYNYDRERRKYHHKVEVNLLIDESEINDYLGEAKKLILDGKFRIALNSNRLTDLSLFDEYLINEESVKSILLNLTVYDFCEKVQNKHANFNHEWLYVFGKEIDLIKRFEEKSEMVPLYIKFNKIEDKFLIVVSFHKQKYPLVYYFQ